MLADRLHDAMTATFVLLAAATGTDERHTLPPEHEAFRFYRLN